MNYVSDSPLGNTLHYRQIDVRDVQGLNAVVKSISDAQGRLDGLIAAAGIQQETPALDYSQADSNMMFEVNVTGKNLNPALSPTIKLTNKA